MADIFISYKKEDAGRVIRIVEALRAEGFSVWWDHGIAPGAQWDQTIQAELAAAKVVMAIWSDQSVNAPWVKEEASVGKNRGILLPVRIDPVDPPLGFSLIQMGDLVGWDGEKTDPHWIQVLGALRAIIRGEAPAGLEAPRRARKGASLWLVGLGAVGLAALVGLGVWALSRQGPGPVVVAQTGTVLPGPQAQLPQGQVQAPQGQAPQAQTAPGPASAQDQAMWDQAMAAKTRTAFQSYLVSFPNGAYAARARDVLLTCRTEQREVWEQKMVAQVYRGVNEALQPTERQACTIAGQMARATAERACRAIAGNPGYRNPRVDLAAEGPCECQPTPGGAFCTADPTFRCSFEQATTQQVETCG